MIWTPERIARVAAGLAEGRSYTQLAASLGVTRSAIASVARRHVHKIPDIRRNHESGRGDPLRNNRPPVAWREDHFVERWADRQARRRTGA